MTLAVLVPVKDLARAKTRLSGLLSEAERAELAGLLLAGVLAAIAQAPSLARASATAASLPPPSPSPQAPLGPEPIRRVVVTAHVPSADLARRLGFEVLPEPSPTSESASVDRASALLAAQGVRGVLRIPLDLPLIDPADVEHLLALIRAGHPALLVPSLSGTGTNGLYRSPPTAFPSRFGPDSVALHEAEARRAGVPLLRVPLPSFALDVDDPQDLREWLRRAHPSPALAYLLSLDIEGRLKKHE